MICQVVLECSCLVAVSQSMLNHQSLGLEILPPSLASITIGVVPSLEAMSWNWSLTASCGTTFSRRYRIR